MEGETRNVQFFIQLMQVCPDVRIETDYQEAFFDGTKKFKCHVQIRFPEEELPVSEEQKEKRNQMEGFLLPFPETMQECWSATTDEYFPSKPSALKAAMGNLLLLSCSL